MKSATPLLSQGSKEKVDMLRKAFTSNKDSQSSRSTKNLASLQQQPAKSGNQAHNFKLQSQSTSTKNQTGISGNGLILKQEKGTKRTDISLIQDA